MARGCIWGTTYWVTYMGYSGIDGNTCITRNVVHDGYNILTQLRVVFS